LIEEASRARDMCPPGAARRGAGRRYAFQRGAACPRTQAIPGRYTECPAGKNPYTGDKEHMV
jgi:hypothetical protein